MAKSTEVVPAAEADTDLVVVEISAEEQALIAANQAEVDASEFQIPILKLAQPLTKEVADGDARPGEFVLGLTGDSFAPPIEFIVAGKGKGRFKPGGDSGRTLVAYDTPTVPDNWDDPLKGTPFSEHPDAEEQYAKAVERGDFPWGSGPPIQTTFNYTGYIVGEDVPVRLSLRRTSAPAARKWNTLLDAVLRGRYWDKTFEIRSSLQKNAKGQPYYVVEAQLGRPTTADEKQKSIELATALRSRAVTTVGDEGDSPLVEPDAAGGLEV